MKLIPISIGTLAACAVAAAAADARAPKPRLLTEKGGVRSYSANDICAGQVLEVELISDEVGDFAKSKRSQLTDVIGGVAFIVDFECTPRNRVVQKITFAGYVGDTAYYAAAITAQNGWSDYRIVEIDAAS